MPRDQPSAKLEMKPLDVDRGYDNALFGKGCHTTNGLVIAEYGAVVD